MFDNLFSFSSSSSFNLANHILTAEQKLYYIVLYFKNISTFLLIKEVSATSNTHFYTHTIKGHNELKTS